jgi:glycosyltransferase involved in cell wall biosynthesis
MKLLFINNSLINLNNKNINKVGGIEHCNIELAQSLSRLGQEVTLVSKIKNKQIVNNLTNLPFNYLTSIENNNLYDIVVSSNYSQVFKFKQKSIKVLWMHNELQIEKSLRKKEFLPIILHSPHVVFVSNYLKQLTTSLYPFKSKTIIPNGCSELFLNNKRNKSIKPIFIWTVKRDRGLDEIIDIWCKIIFKKLPLAELHIHGLNVPKKQNINIDYDKFNIKFFGIVSRDFLANKYKYSTAMLHPGYDETFCISALEALASGLPVITFNRTALAERVINNVNGFIVSTFEDMAAKAIDLAVNKSQLSKLSKNASKSSKKYCWNNVAHTWNKYLNNLKLISN